jgi:hypothetical protein
MKLIKDIITNQSPSVYNILIEFTGGFLRISNKADNEIIYKGLSLDAKLSLWNNSNFKQYPSLSKKELVSFQIIILNAYFFQMDKIEDFKEKEVSIQSIKEEFELAVQIRVHLLSISEYIYSYEELREEVAY